MLPRSGCARLAAALESDPRLDLPERSFRLRFLPGFLEKALGQYGERTSQTLAAWAAATLPCLAVGSHRFSIRVALPLQKSGRIRVELRSRAGKRARPR